MTDTTFIVVTDFQGKRFIAKADPGKGYQMILEVVGTEDPHHYCALLEVSNAKR
jgi:hypothetical protein